VGVHVPELFDQVFAGEASMRSSQTKAFPLDQVSDRVMQRAACGRLMAAERVRPPISVLHSINLPSQRSGSRCRIDEQILLIAPQNEMQRVRVGMPGRAGAECFRAEDNLPS
jgi:hypothetical protein